eukprot:766330-Hanusia_phi.AAC.2
MGVGGSRAVSCTFWFGTGVGESFVERGYLGPALAGHVRQVSNCHRAHTALGLAPAGRSLLRDSGLVLRSRIGRHRIGPMACAPTEDVKVEVNTLNERLWAAAEAGDGDLIRSLVSEGAEVNSQPYVPDAEEESEQPTSAEVATEGFDGSEPIRAQTAALEVNTEAGDKESAEKDEEAKLKEEKEKKKKKKKKEYENKGPSALHLAASKGHSSAACALVDLGGDVNSVTADLTTPLHLAVAGGHIDTVQVLVTLGADLKAKNANGETPLKLGKNAGTNVEVLSLLKAFMDALEADKDEGPAEPSK